MPLQRIRGLTSQWERCRSALTAPAVAVLLTAGAACEQEQQARVGVLGPGRGMTVAEALSLQPAADGPLPIRGHLVVSGDTMLLCQGLTDSPVACREPALPVEGLSPARVEGLESVGGLRFSPAPVVLFGAVRDGVLHYQSLEG